MPTLAVAASLRARAPGVELLYVGSLRAEDRRLVEAAGIKFQGIHTGKLRRYFSFENLIDLFRVGLGRLEAEKILRQFQPDAVFAKGGYVSLPVVMAAGKLKIPVVVHESDSHLGLANKLGLKIANKVAVSWPIKYYWQNEPRLSKYADKFVYTGLPIVTELLNYRAEKVFNENLPIILVTGGSQGAHALNEVVWEGLAKWLQKYNVVHQIGALDIEEGERLHMNLAPELQGRYVPFDFDRKIFLSALHLADVVISRSGSFVFELAALGKPAILVPLPGSASDHQRKNAVVLNQMGAAVMISPEIANNNVLLATVDEILADDSKRMGMVAKIKEFGHQSREAANTIAQIILDVANDKTN